MSVKRRRMLDNYDDFTPIVTPLFFVTLGNHRGPDPNANPNPNKTHILHLTAQVPNLWLIMLCHSTLARPHGAGGRLVKRQNLRVDDPRLSFCNQSNLMKKHVSAES